MESFITGLGTANPDFQRSQAVTADFIANLMNLNDKKRTRLMELFTNSGIENRYSVLEDYTKSSGDFTFFSNNSNFEPFPSTADRMRVYKQEALKLSLLAIENCIATLDGFALNDITHVITVSCTGMYTPGLDIELVQHLKLKTQTQRTAINFMGCYGAFTGLKAANAICKSEPAATVLLVCVELCSLHVQKNQTLDNLFANLLFGDGAAAVIIQSQVTRLPALALENFYCELAPESKQAMTWHIGDTGFEMSLSSYVPKIIKSGIKKFSANLLALQNNQLSDIAFFAIHPGGKKILEACEHALGISAADNRYAYAVMRQFGNMSSCTVLFVIKAILNERNNQDHQKKILGLGFGPGLTLESMLLRLELV
jgi:alpha-pyrone synthase